MTGLLRLVPRGSKLTTSNRAASSAGIGRFWTSAFTPDPPGPPGMWKSTPIRLLGSVAGLRATATSIVPVSGFA
jgi:hypothetical protein